MDETVEATIRHRFPMAPERVFEAWLDPGLVRLWMRHALRTMGLPGEVLTVEIDPREGGAFTFTDARPAGEARHWGTYRVLDAPRTLAFTWFTSPEDEVAHRSLVTLTLDADDGGCAATMVHAMDAAWAEYVPQTERGWRRMLEGIEAVLAQGRGPATTA